jgi:ribulose-phosphate 3-epimerase
MDINYFKYKLYNYDNLQVKSITNSVISEINNFRKIDINKKKIHSVFLPSPIEVEYGSLFKKIIKSSIELGLKRFHIDVGDGRFINRVLNVENKVSYIKQLNQSNNIHVHLMTMNPHHGKDKSYINRYANLGADRIGIHRKSIINKNEINDALVMIKSYGKEAGIFLEVDEMVDENLLNTIIKHNINWVVLMGVPVGFGGQFFNEQVLFKAITLRKFALKEKRNLKIEVDGGLDRDNIIMCKKFGVDYLAGWSLVKSSNINDYKKNINIIKNKLKDA